MKKASKYKMRGNVEELRSDFDRFEVNMRDLKIRLDAVEKEKENLRCVNQMLIQKLKKTEEERNSFQVFLLKRELEKEREKAKLAAEKLVTKQLKCKILQNRFARSIASSFANEDIAMVQSYSELSAVEVIMRQLEEDNRLLKSNIDHLINNEGSLRQEVEKLKDQNQELEARKAAETFTNHVIIESLQAHFKEEETLKANQLENLQIKLKFVNGQIGQLQEMQKRALSAEQKTKEQASVIDQQEKKLSETEIGIKIYDEERYKLKNELDMLRSKIREKDVLLRELDDQLSKLSVGINQLSGDLKHWQSEAERLKEDVEFKEKKISSLEKEKEEIEKEFCKMTKIKREETRIFAEEVASLKVGISVSEKEKADFLKKMEFLKNENSILAERVYSLTEEAERDNVLKVKQEGQMLALQEKNEELNEMISEVTHSLRKLKKKPWWRKIVSCS